MALVLRRAWLVGLAITAVIGGGGALVMRLELLDAGRTLSPELYSSAFSLYVALTGMVVAALIAVPTLISDSRARWSCSAVSPSWCGAP